MFEKLIKKITNIAKINYNLDEVEINYVIKPNFATLKQDFENMSEAIKAINMNKFEISGDIKNGEVVGEYNGVKIDYERHILKEIEISGDAVTSDFSGGSVILHTRQDEILLEEGYLRELFRRVQDIRKAMGLEKSQEIEVSFAGSDGYYLDIVSNWGSVISKKVGAKDILEKEVGEVQTFEIKGKRLSVSVREL